MQTNQIMVNSIPVEFFNKEKLNVDHMQPIYACTDYGQYLTDIINNVKSGKTKEEAINIFLSKISEEVLKRNTDKLINNGIKAVKIVVMANNNGYTPYVCFPGYEKYETLEEKIDRIYNTLPNEVKIVFDKYLMDKDIMKKILVGRGGNVKTVRPDNSILYYYWRMTRFNTGRDPTLPVIAQWELERGIETEINRKLSRTEQKQVNEYGDLTSSKIAVDYFGKEAIRGSYRWGKLLGTTT